MLRDTAHAVLSQCWCPKLASRQRVRKYFEVEVCLGVGFECLGTGFMFGVPTAINTCQNGYALAPASSSDSTYVAGERNIPCEKKPAGLSDNDQVKPVKWFSFLQFLQIFGVGHPVERWVTRASLSGLDRGYHGLTGLRGYLGGRP